MGGRVTSLARGNITVGICFAAIRDGRSAACTRRALVSVGAKIAIVAIGAVGDVGGGASASGAGFRRAVVAIVARGAVGDVGVGASSSGAGIGRAVVPFIRASGAVGLVGKHARRAHAGIGRALLTVIATRIGKALDANIAARFRAESFGGGAIGVRQAIDASAAFDVAFRTLGAVRVRGAIRA